MNFSQNPIGDYDRVNKFSAILKPVNIDAYTPVITKRDRNIGEIFRYFVRFTTHKSPADITEVSKTTYTLLKRNPLYQTIRIKWRITGKLEDGDGLPNDGSSIRLQTGVLTSNKLSVELANETMSGLTEYIIDYKRFWEE